MIEQFFPKQEKYDKQKMQKTLDFVIEKRNSKEENFDEKIEDEIKNLPKELKEKISVRITELKEWGIIGEKLVEATKTIIREIKESYLDKRFDMPNKPFAKIETINKIDHLLGKKPKIQDLKKIARVSFDLNGLKAVNDLTKSHEKGDEYLNIIASALKDEKIAQWFKEKDIEILATADGGDEFGVILNSDEDIDYDILDEFMKKIKNILLKNPEAKKILNFEDEKIILAFNGISKKEFKNKDEIKQKEIIAYLKKQVPKNFKFIATVSAGAATLYESFENTDIAIGDSYEKSLQKMMGSLFDLSDAEMQLNKNNFKDKLSKSDDPHKQFLLKIYSRTDSERKIKEENTRLKEENTRLKKMIETMHKNKK